MENNLDPNNDLTTIVFEPANVIVTGQKNQTVSGSSLVKNIGTTRFTCRSVAKSCGCTTPSGIDTGTIIEPGESKELFFSIELSTPADKFIYVHGNCTTISLRITKQITA